MADISHCYVVDFDSPLGLQFKNYITRCTAADTAAKEFAATHAHRYGLTCVDADTELVYSDDCEAGGLLGFSIRKSTFDELASDMRIAVLWDSIPDADHPDHVIVFPRCERHAHHIRYRRAVELHTAGAEDWEFITAPSRRKSDEGKIIVKPISYDQVRHIISREDARALVSRDGETPAANVRLALGRQYVINTDTLPTHMLISVSTYRSEAIALFREMNALPNVAAHTLSRLLRLDTAADNKDLHDICHFRWKTDHNRHQYVITTGLRVTHTDAKEVE